MTAAPQTPCRQAGWLAHAARLLKDAPGRSPAFSTLECDFGLLMPFGRLAQNLLLLCGAAGAVCGAYLSWALPSGSWQALAGAAAVDFGWTSILLVIFGRAPGGRIVLNPLTGLLAAYALRRLLGIVYVASQASSLESPFDAVPTAAYLVASAKAEWVTLAGTAAFSLGWILARRRGVVAKIDLPLRRGRTRRLWVVYFLGLAVFLGNRLSQGALGRLGNFVTSTGGLAFGATFALLAFSLEYGVEGRLRIAAYAAAVPLTLHAFTHGMKSSFFAGLLPVGIAFLLRKPRKALFLGAAGTVFLLVFVYPYVETFRFMNWAGGGGAPVEEVIQFSSEYVKQEGIAATLSRSWETFLLRFGGVNEAGAVIYFADEHGLMGAFFLQNLAYGFIPRLLWPGKPAWDPSGWFTEYLTGAAGEAISSTALHIGPELYWMYGWAGTVFGLLLLGIFYRNVSDWLLVAARSSPVFLAAWYCFFVSVAFIEEVRYNMAVLSPFILVSSALAVHWLLKLFPAMPLPAHRRRPSAAQSGYRS